ncbi:MAG: calcineurin [Ruminococcus sp.]|nr:calcineurin [Ruminococcus sp.]MDY4909234.1 calcineurin [Candidatus Fimenecus sp.]
MTYVISDLHGYRIEKLKELLEKTNFSEDDRLYILGDVIDRNGDGGIGVLQWLIKQPNAELIMGNHEAMLLACVFIFENVTDAFLEDFDEKKNRLLINYLFNGGGVTLRNLAKLDINARYDIVNYLHKCPLYKEVNVNGEKYILVHAGLDNFSPDKKINDYSANELLWAEPELNDEYYDYIHTVFGHTPTHLFGEQYNGKIVETRTWTCIDCGAASGNEPVLFRLDDKKEFKL